MLNNILPFHFAHIMTKGELQENSGINYAIMKMFFYTYSLLSARVSAVCLPVQYSVHLNTESLLSMNNKEICLMTA